ncbi:HID1 domain containing protein [Aureococcus anophagefferens]|uniref:HID1 domain containing protein n=1 Tax=Aureococcus anophagefferens TaxID=44056 RepID=A0ABR1G7V7_AURAN
MESPSTSSLTIQQQPRSEDDGDETVCCGIFEKDDEDVEFGQVGPVLLSVLIVVCGTASTITSKLQYEVRSAGFVQCKYHDDDGHADDDLRTRRECLFTKPWFQTLVMKIAMSTCLVISMVAKYFNKRAKAASAPSDPELGAGLLGGEKRAARGRADDQTVLSQAGLIWVSSSAYQMTLARSVIVFTCALSVRYMGKKMEAVHWVSVIIVCLAIVVVGVVGAVQFVLEEWLMNECDVTPTLLVGWEGVWGVGYFLILAPVLSYTPTVNDDGELASASTIWHENFAETWDQLKNSTDLIILTIASMVALLVYNLVGNMVTKQLSAIMRSILESCRTLGVWVTSIVIYYGWHDSKSGEEWTNWSYLEFVGFVLLVYGTVAYKEILPIPGISKTAPSEAEQ